jgi:hypothetical protein
MAKKYEIIGNDLYISDTVTSEIYFQEAAKKCISVLLRLV